MKSLIENACDTAQEALWDYFWNPKEGAFENHYPIKEEELWCYWWHAHAVDALLDGYERTKDEKYLKRIEEELKGIYTKNGNTFIHNWYDDMEWMALAQLRLWDATSDATYKEQVLVIWEDIKTAWNDHMNGGLAWKKDQLDYKNTPANGPAAILAYRLYSRFGNEADLQWGNRILDWNIKYLVEEESGFVWDGMNRQGDGQIDYDWKFTYCQGVIVGALIERYKITKNEEYLQSAIKTAREACNVIADEDGIFPYEGENDCGLFKGIYMRYVLELLQTCPTIDDLSNMIQKNATCIIEKGMNDKNLIGGDWRKKETDTIDLAQHLSGVMMLEMANKLI